MSNDLISPIYKILLLYEDIKDTKSVVTEDDYLKYLDRLYIRCLGDGNEEIYKTIHGLRLLGAEAHHGMVKSTVFHLISLIEGKQKSREGR